MNLLIKILDRLDVNRIEGSIQQLRKEVKDQSDEIIASVESVHADQKQGFTEVLATFNRPPNQSEPANVSFEEEFRPVVKSRISETPRPLVTDHSDTSSDQNPFQQPMAETIRKSQLSMPRNSAEAQLTEPQEQDLKSVQLIDTTKTKTMTTLQNDSFCEQEQSKTNWHELKSFVPQISSKKFSETISRYFELSPSSYEIQWQSTFINSANDSYLLLRGKNQVIDVLDSRTLKPV